MKAGRKILAVILSLVMLASTFAAALVPSYAVDNPVNDQLSGGVAIYFLNSSDEKIDYIDLSSSTTIYARIHNYSDRYVTIKSINNSQYFPSDLVAFVNGGTALAPGVYSRPFNVSALGTTDNQFLDFTFTYTIEGVYNSDGRTLAVFTQPAFIGAWYPTDDLTDIGNNTGHSQFGFTIKNGECDVTNRFMTDLGILEQVSESGDYSSHVDFTYNFWIDSTDMASKTWEATGFRMFAQKWGNQRMHFQPAEVPDSLGTFTLGGQMGNPDSVSLTMQDLRDITTDWYGPYSYSEYPTSGTTPNTYVANKASNFTAKRAWGWCEATQWGTLYNSDGDCGFFPFQGTLVQGSTTSSSPATIRFNNMLWYDGRPASGNPTGTFSGTINVYSFDKTELKDYVARMANRDEFAPISGRFNSTVWSAYTNAYREAMRVIANRKTNQYAVTQAYNALVSACNALSNNANLANQVTSITHKRHTGDKGGTVEATDVRYILAPIGNFTVPYLADYKNATGINKCTAPIITNYSASDTNLNDAGTYDYWTIDLSGVAPALAAANEILNKEWCWSDSYIASLTSARDTVAAIDTNSYTATPELQSTVNNAVAALNNLTGAKDSDSNHTHVPGEWTFSPAPDCDTAGTRVKTCTYCGKVCVSEEVGALGHSYSDWNTVKDANCTETGLKRRVCSVCSNVDEEVIPITSSVHKGPNETRNKTEGNCGTDGYTGDLYCTACNTLISKGEVIPASGNHNYVSVERVEGTCKLNGHEKFVCDICNDEKTEDLGTDPDNHVGGRTTLYYRASTCTVKGYSGDIYCDDCNNVIETGHELDLADHTPGDWVTEESGNCGKDGRRVKYCTAAGCNQIVADEVIPATGNHTPQTVPGRDSTCTETGLTEGSICSVCNKVLVAQEIIQMKAHTPPEDWDEVVAPKCGVDGYKAKYCTVCGTEIERRIIPAATDHTFEYVEGTRTESTCHTPGTEQYKCSGCGFVETRNLPLNPDNHESTETVLLRKADATCAKDGYTGDVCRKCCEAVITAGSVIPKETVEHTWAESSRDAATCIAEGTVYFECSVCGAEKTDTLPIDHSNHGNNTEVRDAADATCTDDGYTGDVYCLDCGEIKEHGSVIDAKDHTPGRRETVREATCTEAGINNVYCSVCGEFIDIEEISAKGHTVVVVAAVEPTCTESGLTQGMHCSACDAVIAAQTVIPALGHESGDWVIITEADCGHEGRREKRCIRCDAVLAFEVTPVTGQHHYAVVDTAVSTCSTHGYNLYECESCGNSIKEELSLDPSNHEGPEELDGYVEVTCGADGYTGDTVCKACGEILAKGEVVPATGVHTYDEGVFITTATKEHNGVKRFTCQFCDDYYDVEVVWAPHKHHGGENNATCTTRAKCSECGEPYGEYNNSNHTGLVPVEEVAATCSEAGHGTGVYCESCRKYATEPVVIPALEHTDENGDHICDMCGVDIPEVITQENFRCSMCDKYEANKDKPGIGFIYKIIHAIVHFFESLSI